MAKILVFDGDSETARRLAYILGRNKGDKVESVTDFDELSERVGEAFDVVVVGDPVVGYTNLDAVRLVFEHKNVRSKVIAISKCADEDQVSAVLQLGVNSHLTKPVAPEAAREVLREALGR